MKLDPNTAGEFSKHTTNATCWPSSRTVRSRKSNSHLLLAQRNRFISLGLRCAIVCFPQVRIGRERFLDSASPEPLLVPPDVPTAGSRYGPLHSPIVRREFSGGESVLPLPAILVALSSAGVAFRVAQLGCTKVCTRCRQFRAFRIIF